MFIQELKGDKINKIILSKTFQNILMILSLIFLSLSVVLYIIIIFNKTYLNVSGIIDVELATKFGSFFQGLVGTTSGVSGSLLIILVFLLQNKNQQINQIESIYFKMIDFHRENVRSMELNHYEQAKHEKFLGQRSFVIYKLQLFGCIQITREAAASKKIEISDDEILDIAYMIFFYGLDHRWDDFSEKVLHNTYKAPGRQDA
jgi:hypothetical protein